MPLTWLDRIVHDLRGPLTPLQTAAYLLRSGQVDAARQPELLDVIERQVRQLARMVDELGDWTRANDGRLVGSRELCEPALLLDYARTGTSSDVPPPVVDDACDGAQVEGDPQRLTQLLTILLCHAAARGNGRSPEVSLHASDGSLRIDVRDRGPTPDPLLLAKLLQEPQGEPYDNGLGLRLLLARRIAEAHGGTLVALADADGGLRLRCELPLAAPATP